MARGFLLGRIVLAFLLAGAMMMAFDDDLLVRNDDPQQVQPAAGVLSLELR
jgi:hypothetical protein